MDSSCTKAELQRIVSIRFEYYISDCEPVVLSTYVPRPANLVNLLAVQLVKQGSETRGFCTEFLFTIHIIYVLNMMTDIALLLCAGMSTDYYE